MNYAIWKLLFYFMNVKNIYITIVYVYDWKYELDICYVCLDDVVHNFYEISFN